MHCMPTNTFPGGQEVSSFTTTVPPAGRHPFAVMQAVCSPSAQFSSEHTTAPTNSPLPVQVAAMSAPCRLTVRMLYIPGPQSR